MKFVAYLLNLRYLPQQGTVLKNSLNSTEGDKGPAFEELVI